MKYIRDYLFPDAHLGIVYSTNQNKLTHPCFNLSLTQMHMLPIKTNWLTSWVGKWSITWIWNKETALAAAAAARCSWFYFASLSIYCNSPRGSLL